MIFKTRLVNYEISVEDITGKEHLVGTVYSINIAQQIVAIWISLNPNIVLKKNKLGKTLIWVVDTRYQYRSSTWQDIY